MWVVVSVSFVGSRCTSARRKYIDYNTFLRLHYVCVTSTRIHRLSAISLYNALPPYSKKYYNILRPYAFRHVNCATSVNYYVLTSSLLLYIVARVYFYSTPRLCVCNNYLYNTRTCKSNPPSTLEESLPVFRTVIYTHYLQPLVTVST